MRLIRIVVVLALAYSSSALANDGELKKLFFDSAYTYCDAHFISKTFEMDVSSAKAFIGQKIQWGTTDILDGDLDRAREKGKTDRTVRCQFYQTGLGLDDAAALASYWGTSTSEAKTRAEDKILWGNEKYLKDTVLPEAKRAVAAKELYKEGDESGVESAADQANFQGYAASSYTYCHAKMLVGTFFGSSVAEAKSVIGYKVLNGMESQVSTELDKVRKKHQAASSVPCPYHETGYSYDDATTLAKLWGQSVEETKARVERKFAWGSEGILADELKRAGTQGF